MKSKALSQLLATIQSEGPESRKSEEPRNWVPWKNKGRSRKFSKFGSRNQILRAKYSTKPKNTYLKMGFIPICSYLLNNLFNKLL